MSNSPTLFSSDDEDEDHRQEGTLLKKFQAMLQGVPPPSSVTMSKLSATEMLSKYYENISSFDFKDKSPKKYRKKSNATPLVYNSNSSKISEEIANLSQKVLSRYIYSETMSSCNIWFDSSAKTGSAKKYLSRRNRLGFSPGSRLSHLARRRQIFSYENLQKLANSDRRHHIEIEKRNASKTRSLTGTSVSESEKNSSIKRALFLSPENDEVNGSKLYTSSQPNLISSSYSNIVSEKKKFILFPQRHENEFLSKKRKGLDSRERNWPRRALTFSEKELNDGQESGSINTKVISDIQVSLHHKAKLLWAVSVTLKEKNIHSSHPQFKLCASALFMICRKNLNKILHAKNKESTSDKILQFARQHIDDLLKKLDVPCGKKSPDRIEQEVVDDSDSGVYSESAKETSNNDKSLTILADKNSESCSDISLPSFSIPATQDGTQCINEKENISCDFIS